MPAAIPDQGQLVEVRQRHFVVLDVVALAPTQTYNRFHNPRECDTAAPGCASDIGLLRQLHTEMHRAVADAYGWTDLDLDHDFHETKRGIRSTVSEPARREILDRLLALNHQRYQQKLEQGLLDRGARTKAPKAKRTCRTTDTRQGDLF